MMRPIEPTRDDCCGSGCNPCIFDEYEKQLKLYVKYMDQAEHSCNCSDYGISQLAYTKFNLVDVVQLSNTQKILMFQQSTSNCNKKIWWHPGDHFLIKYTKSNNESCTRAYTPIKLNDICSKDYDFLIVVKKYINGLVSNYLFNLIVGEETKWRGPYGSYSVQPNKYRRIVMIAQGTGLAPFLSIIKNILNNEEDMTKIILYYCCKETNEILFRNELYEFNSYWNFLYTIFLSNTPEESLKDIKYNEPLVNKKFNIKELDNLKSCLNDQFLLCGSVEFMKEYETILKNENYSDNVILF